MDAKERIEPHPLIALMDKVSKNRTNGRERIEELIDLIEFRNEENKKTIARLKKEISKVNPTLWIDEATNLARKKARDERLK